MKDVIHIKEPFYSAGKKYGWQGKPIGLGIDLRLLEGEGIIRVKVGDNDKVWRLTKLTARDFIKRHNSYFQAKTVKLGIIAWHLFFEDKPDENIKQESLF